MNKQILTYPLSQQVLLRDIHDVLEVDPEYRYFSICRKYPTFEPRDPLTSELLQNVTWIKGYAKSAKALVQRGILIQEGYCCYSLTQHGRRLLGLEAQS